MIRLTDLSRQRLPWSCRCRAKVQKFLAEKSGGHDPRDVEFILLNQCAPAPGRRRIAEYSVVVQFADRDRSARHGQGFSLICCQCRATTHWPRSELPPFVSSTTQAPTLHPDFANKAGVVKSSVISCRHAGSSCAHKDQDSKQAGWSALHAPHQPTLCSCFCGVISAAFGFLRRSSLTLRAVETLRLGGHARIAELGRAIDRCLGREFLPVLQV